MASIAAAGLEVHEAGRALRVQTEAPHLVSMGSGRLSTAVTLHPLPEGTISLGSDRDADILVAGTGVEPIHCAIENNNGVVTLHPVNGNTFVDGVPINSPVRLAQGCMLSIGRSNYMRFNHPAEAKHLRSVLPHSRISMASINFALSDGPSQENHHLERKPPVAPRKSPRNSCSDDEIGFLGKLTKFEMLSKQSRSNCVSPKVFPAGALTTNVPADQILGHSRSSSLVSLTKSPINGCNDHSSQNSAGCHDETRQRSDSRLGTPGRSNAANLQNHNQIRMYTAEAYVKTCKPYYREGSNRSAARSSSTGTTAAKASTVRSGDLMSRSMTCQSSNEFDHLADRSFDMSQSLIVTKTTTTEFLQLEKYGSNPSICNASCIDGDPNTGIPKPSVAHGFGSASNIKRIQPPSPAFNRNPRYSEQKRVYARVKSPTPSAGSSCSLEELRERQADAENKRKEAETKRKQAQEERLREQEVERQEKMRLEEIVAMCAEYERQSAVEKPRQPNRIITNGSLPRDKRLGGYTSPFDSPKSPSKNQPHFSFDTGKQGNWNSLSYENVSVQNSKIIFQHGNSLGRDRRDQSAQPEHHSCDVGSPQATTPNNNQPAKYSNVHNMNGNYGFSSSVSQARGSNYENVIIGNNNKNGGWNTDGTGGPIKANDDTKGSASIYGTIRLNGTKIEPQATQNGNANHYENITLSSTMTRNNNQNHSMPKKNSQLSNSYEMIENKLAVSNDDLLEAIEQLSMMSKSKEICVTPKRNNSEKDNAKSNEVKADKARKQLEEEDRKKYIEFLQNEKLHILSNMDALKRSVAEIEIQEEEISRELELEKALLSAEYESESLKLTQDEGEKIKVQTRINELEREMAEDNATHSNLQAEAKQRVQKVQQACVRLDEQLSISKGEAAQQDIAEKLAAQQDVLESERKAFEDLEFHHLEEEASKLATREELQRYLSELTSKIEGRKLQLNHLESQRSEVKKTATKEAKSLERQKLGHLKRLEEARNRVREINEELGYLAQNSAEHSEEKRSPSREDFDRISRVTNDSPIVNYQGSLGRKTIESLKEIERNRQLHLAKQGSQVISEERRRVEELKRRVQDEVRSQWEERKMNCASFNSVESGEESSSYSTGPTESGSGSSDGAEGRNSEKLSPSKLSELTSPSPGPSNNSYSLHQNDNSPLLKRGKIVTIYLVPFWLEGGFVDLRIGPGFTLKNRSGTRDRLVFGYSTVHETFSSGTSNLLALLDGLRRSNGVHWNKRWFVFDRKRKTLSYYSDNTSRKARGIIYFQSIEEVYVDHMNTVRSPQPSLTFIVKTSSRLYHLMAPSPEAMRVWVDVVFTGAEGYHEFDHGI
ncbi:uncharacterized protein LOC105276749 [Ooceraea biroi]|uniref:uncharacterized protein LOC105276749 n=1 Tax=Ooceraea biroi TaxID=2015173 RepID=UPI000F0927DE|nr:uncharacterized protein LOC105276749 [Ooceraea biroi]